MESAGYVTLTRQGGLVAEMQAVANNIANSSTTGFRREGVVFTEYVKAAPDTTSLSLGRAGARIVDLSEGGLANTGGRFDFAIRGEGFFLVETDRGQRLTRAGSFTPGPDGVLRTTDGHALLDAGATQVTVPPGARDIRLGPDGTMAADGLAFARIGVWSPADPMSLRHEGGTLFEANAVEPVSGSELVQGSLEESNVNPVAEVARLIEVQRAYELGQGFLDREDERLRGVIRTLGG